MLLAVWLWPGQNVPPSMGPVLVVPVLQGPMPSATFPPGPGPSAVTQPPASPGPSCTHAGGRAVRPSPPPEADDGKDASGNGPGGTGAEGVSQVPGDDEKPSRVPRGDTDEDEDGDGDGDDQDQDENDEDKSDEEQDEDTGKEASRGHRGDADDEWDD